MNKEATFKQAYGVLTQHAETLRNQDEPNIDDLLKIVTESVEAYKVCKGRIDAVEKALEEALKSAELEPPGRAPAAAPAPAAPVGDDADDIPF
jgi:exodeoxyribonuclease VII small subunit